MVSDDGRWSIGELAARAGVTVKTVRFYSDRGLLPEAGRSAGGHRRYGPESLDRLRLVRSLRGLGVPVPEVERVLSGADGSRDPGGALEEVLAGRLREVGSRLAALRWQEASLCALRDSPAGERAERLALLGALPSPPGTAPLVAFWRRSLPARLPRRVVAAVLDAVVPEPPAAPDPGQVLAFARLHALVSGPVRGGGGFRVPPPLPEGSYRPGVLYEGLAEAYALAAAEAREGREPDGGAALDGFVAAYAAALGARDTPEFRRGLLEPLARGACPSTVRYWKLAAGLFPPGRPVVGALHHRLSLALRDQVAREAA
ncbi:MULTISPECIES: MerR family transcriptional regulator [unclassified Streptomyces]|uniref:MerR family transcriptional regulator n=1 Tax=unclassified Streptomyces TaxID=2593676 RepID=UPI00367AAA28